MTYLFIIFICLILLFTLFINNSSHTPQHEQFHNLSDYSNNSIWEPVWHGKVTSDCYDKNKKDCLNYSNCGLCYKNKKLKCVPGDVQGPLFKQNCKKWMYKNYYDRFLYGKIFYKSKSPNNDDNTVTRISDPWNAFYPGYEIKYPGPVTVSTLL